MDDDLIAIPADQDDKFEKVPCRVRPKDQPAVGILTEVVDHQRVLDSMEHVGRLTRWAMVSRLVGGILSRAGALG